MRLYFKDLFVDKFLLFWNTLFTKNSDLDLNIYIP